MPKNLPIKNVPDEIIARLRAQARRRHRSLQGELLAILEEAVQPRRLTVPDLQRRVEELGLRTKGEAVRLIRELRNAR